RGRELLDEQAFELEPERVLALHLRGAVANPRRLGELRRRERRSHRFGGGRAHALSWFAIAIIWLSVWIAVLFIWKARSAVSIVAMSRPRSTFESSSAPWWMRPPEAERTAPLAALGASSPPPSGLRWSGAVTVTSEMRPSRLPCAVTVPSEPIRSSEASTPAGTLIGGSSRLPAASEISPFELSCS